ncbi:MAG: homoserine dehydrogenase, partial [Dehalococcoidia bacterium]|nr:homoserine dehydrogenase [Dehalococcoidia bacterium]
IVIELMGGEHPALEYMKEALACGKWVVTANKEVMSKHGYELLSLAREHGVDIFCEASVGGGIPLVATFRNELGANRISSIHAIINGTTNYILTSMAKENMDFASALKQAQEKGYAEPDPTSDIEGKDAAYKLAILATLAFHVGVHPDDIYCEGITHLDWRDFSYAQELGYVIKLLAIAREEDGAIEVRVHPTFIAEDVLLAKVDGVFNAVQIEGDLVGKTLLYGQGAGALPTSSAVVGDVIRAAQNIAMGRSSGPELRLDAGKKLKPISEIETRYYIRMNVVDKPGVLAQITRVLGESSISISSVIQKLSNAEKQTAEIVVMTHPARESEMQCALRQMEELSVVDEISNFIRVE